MAMLARTSRVTIIVLCSIFVGTLSALAPSSPSAAASVLDGLGAIDSDGNGRVSLTEIEDFARKSGIASREVRDDFRDLDSNKDGELDSQEMSGLAVSTALSQSSASTAARAESAALATPAAQATPAAPVAMGTPAVVGANFAAPATESVPGLEALELDVRHQAGAIIAEGLAKRAQAMIKQGEKDEKEAQSFEAKAIALRGSSKKVTEGMGAEAQTVSADTVRLAAKAGLIEAQQLLKKSEEVENDSHKHRDLAKEALKRASQAQDGMSVISHHISLAPPAPLYIGH